MLSSGVESQGPSSKYNNIIKKNDNDKENPIYGKKKLGTTESSPVKQIQKKIQMNKKIHEM